MIVYANREQRVCVQTFIRAIIEADPLERLIRLGQLEAAVADLLSPDCDDLHPVARALRQVAIGETPVAALHSLELPEEIGIRTPEGFAFYGLYPCQYVRAAIRFIRDHRPAKCFVLGIRSIGTSLSAVLTQALRDRGVVVSSWTVRPRGHPFDREIRLSEPLIAYMRQHADGLFCIVDEGPGISGSSFASVAEAVSSLGVPDQRIILFPGHLPDIASLRNQKAQNRFARHPVYVEPFRRDDVVPVEAVDLSGGHWRDDEWCQVPVQPQHERRKYLHDGKMWKFAGLGHLGRSKFERARILSDAGFIPPVVDLRDGFIISDSVQRLHVSPNELLNMIVRYLVFLRREFATDQPVPYAALSEMIRVNTGMELPGSDASIEDGTVIAVDGRMQPHEWVGKLKADALDHHDDHFFPGCQDIAWDIAGAAVEFGLPQSELVERYLQLQSDLTLRRRVVFYRRAYLAYRIGYTHMAAEALSDSDDGRGFASLKERYTAALTAGPTSSNT